MDTGGIGGHPRGLTTLFFTEMWERFSYYGMRALLILFMVKTAADGGLGYDTKKAAAIYGTYTMSVYLLSILGGFIADNFIGARRSVLIGGIIIACGHFTMAFSAQSTFFAGLVLIAHGTGLLKPNISTMVGSLYSPTDERRDAGFSIFYMGINIGAFLAPLVTGYLAQSASWKAQLTSWGLDPVHSWHWGFAAAGVGMTFGVVMYVLQRERLAQVGHAPLHHDCDEANHTCAITLFSHGVETTAVEVDLIFTPQLIFTGLARSPLALLKVNPDRLPPACGPPLC